MLFSIQVAKKDYLNISHRIQKLVILYFMIILVEYGKTGEQNSKEELNRPQNRVNRR